jgi:hypothetical protein
MYTIVKTTPYAIFVSNQESSLKLPGESFARGYGSPDFIIEKNATLQWSNLDGSKSDVEAKERDSILEFVLETLRAKGWDITAE